MKVLIVNNMAPFIWGGAEALAAHLQKNLMIAGHEAEILRIPFQWEPCTRILSQMLMVRALELYHVDHVIALKFPAYLIRHPRKTLWLLHQYRQAYDLFEAGHSNLLTNQYGEEIRALIQQADYESFEESRHIFTNSKITEDRLLKFNNVHSKVLVPPINDPELFTGSEEENYIFAGGRINTMKRQHLLIEAMQYTDQNVRLIIAGPPDAPEDAERLHQRVEQLSLTHRVKLDLRFLPREVYAHYINQSSAVAYLPYDEDSLGYVTMEAAMAHKALLTTTDSGGVLGLVHNQQTGLVTDPNPKGLAKAMNFFTKNKQQTKDYGKAAQQLWLGFNATWAKTIETLLK